MRARLADSLDYVFAQIGGQLGVKPTCGRRLTDSVRRDAQSPHVFGAYYELVLAVESDDLEGARLRADELRARGNPASGTVVAALEDRPAFEADRYRRFLLDEPGMADQPSAALLIDFRERLDGAFNLLDTGFPQMAAEIRSLLREIVVAAGPEDPKARTFDGSSSYMLWGAVLLNARGQKTVLDTAQALAHESGHNLLFGFCSSGSLVENTDDELFESPLRSDARPMDGVFHATYVIARMHQTLSRLLNAGILNEIDQVAARKDLEIHRVNFDAGDQVIREGARLTEIGRGAIESARAYMAGTH